MVFAVEPSHGASRWSRRAIDIIDDAIFASGPAMAGDSLLVIEPLDSDPLAQLRRAMDLREVAEKGVARGARLVLEGGLLVAAADLAVTSGVGVKLGDGARPRTAEDWFDEAPGRLLVAVANSQDSIERAEAAGCQAELIGVVGGDALVCGTGLSIPLDRLRAKYAGFLCDMVAVPTWSACPTLRHGADSDQREA